MHYVCRHTHLLDQLHWSWKSWIWCVYMCDHTLSWVGGGKGVAKLKGVTFSNNVRTFEVTPCFSVCGKFWRSRRWIISLPRPGKWYIARISTQSFKLRRLRAVRSEHNNVLTLYRSFSHESVLDDWFVLRATAHNCGKVSLSEYAKPGFVWQLSS